MTINQSLLGQESKVVARLCVEDPDLEVIFKHFLANFCALVDHIDRQKYPEELFDQLIHVVLLLHANMPKM